LSEAETARMARFRYPGDRRRYLVAHGALREILAEFTGSGNPSELRFREGAHGKPFLVPMSNQGVVQFSLSHSGELAMVAVSASREVGVDVEKIRPNIDVMAIAHRYFAPEEAARLGALSDADRTAAFFTLWTRKEAYSKARGMALAPALREIPEDHGGWYAESIDMDRYAGDGFPAGYAAAVAYGVADFDLCGPKSNRRPMIILTMR